MFRREINNFRIRVSEVEFVEEIIYSESSQRKFRKSRREKTHLDYSSNLPRLLSEPIASIPVYA